MSEETHENQPAKEKSQEPQATSVKSLLEGKAILAGEQGMLLKPVGSHDTDPFASRDVSVATADQPSPSASSGPQPTDSPDGPPTASSSTSQGGAENE
jgi:hypothetical protein